MSRVKSSSGHYCFLCPGNWTLCLVVLATQDYNDKLSLGVPRNSQRDGRSRWTCMAREVRSGGGGAGSIDWRLDVTEPGRRAECDDERGDDEYAVPRLERGP
jgi:hypothetical protein